MAARFGPSSAPLALLQKTALSHRIRTVSNQSSRILITDSWLDPFIANCRLPTPLQQANNLILAIGDKMIASVDNYRIDCTTLAIIGCVDEDRCALLLAELRSKGLVMMLQGSGDEEFFLSLEGWSRYEDLKRGSAGGDYGFLALQFGDAILEKFLAEVLKPAVKEGIGYDVVDMRDSARAGTIDNILREKIRDSAFVIADLTHDNSGAYWEAGYAEGLGKPVIYICERAKFEKARTHFDTNHSTTVPWEVDRPGQFKSELVATLRRSLNLFPGQSETPPEF
jgi:hypothetical protein